MSNVALAMNDAPTEKPLVLLAPFPFDSRVWAEVVDHLDGRAITVDPPGFGGSQALDDASLEAYARGVLAALDEHGVGTFTPVGNSMGGYVAMALAELAPERLAGIGLVGTKASADADEPRQTRLDMAEKAEAGTPASELVGPSIEKVLGAHTRESNPQLVDQVGAWLATAPAAGIAWAQRAMAARPDRLDALRALDVPAVVLHGRDDALMTASDHAALADALGVQVQQLECGHLLPLEAPEAVAEALRALS